MSETEKLFKVAEEANKIGAFLEWLLHDECYELYQYDESENGSFPVYMSINELLADYYGINLQKLEEEKMEALRNLRHAV